MDGSDEANKDTVERNSRDQHSLRDDASGRKKAAAQVDAEAVHAWLRSNTEEAQNVFSLPCKSGEKKNRQKKIDAQLENEERARGQSSARQTA